MAPRSILKSARTVLVNLVLCVLVLVALDLVFGDWLSDDNLGPVRVPRSAHIENDVNRLYPRLAKALYSRDRFGLRGAYGDVSEIDILTLGGSTTDQLYIDDAETWQAVLAGAFAEAGRPVSVVNAGVQGQSTIGHIANFKYWFPRVEGLGARYMLLYVGLNDIYAESHAWDDAIVKTSTGARLQQMYRNNSVYAWLYKLIKGMLRAREIGLIHPSVDFDGYPWTDKPMYDDHRQRYADRLAAYEARLRRLLALIRDFGSVPILLTQPRGDVRLVDGKMMGLVDGLTDNADIYPVNNGLDRQIVMSMFNEVTLKVCLSIEDTICVPLAEEVRFAPEDFYDWGHTTPPGGRRIGRYLFEVLRPYLIAGIAQ